MLGYIGGIPNANQNTNYRKNLSKKITYELENKEFGSCSKDSRSGAFTRERKLTLKNLIVMIICFKSSIQRELDRFFKDLSRSDFNIREVTKSAFTQARAKLKFEAFKRLNEITVKAFYDEAEYYVWHNMRTFAVDGTRLMLPNHPTVKEEFGEHSFGPKSDSKRSLAVASMLYDVFNHITVDAEIAPYASSENDLLIRHLPKLNKGDLLLLDRGYPCFWLLFLLKAKGIEFCVRLKENWWIKVKEFSESSDMERIVSFTLPKKDHKKLFEHPKVVNQEIYCRLIKVELPTGEIEILCTSLLDQEEYKHEEFDELYHYRWGEEEAYKLLKSRVELENFSGKTATAVKQDFHAKVFLLSLCAAYAHPIEDKVREEFKADENRKHSQKINRTNAISMTQNILLSVFIRKQYEKALKAFDEIVFNTREIIRLGRSNPRNHIQKKPYSMNYKRL